MGNILSGLVMVNGTDIWTEYGVFLVEDRRGGMDNLTAILTPSKAKKDTAVDIREEHGEKYSPLFYTVIMQKFSICCKFSDLVRTGKHISVCLDVYKRQIVNSAISACGIAWLIICRRVSVSLV